MVLDSSRKLKKSNTREFEKSLLKLNVYVKVTLTEQVSSRDQIIVERWTHVHVRVLSKIF